jgi:hypothetical protein
MGTASRADPRLTLGGNQHDGTRPLTLAVEQRHQALPTIAPVAERERVP